MPRWYNSVRATFFLGPFAGFPIALMWCALAGLPIFGTSATVTVDWGRVLFWTAVLVAMAVAYGAWIYRSVPNFPRVFGVAIVLVACWAAASVLFGTIEAS